MRILFTAQPMYGHVNTVLPMALAAQQSGHEVVVVTGASLAHHVERYGLEIRRAGPTAAPRGHDVDWISYFVESARQRAETLMPLVRSWRPDIVIHEETELAGAIAAAAVGARPVVHGLGLMPPMRLWELFAAAIEALARDWSSAFDTEALRETTYLDVCPPSLAPTWERPWRRVLPVRPSTGLTRPGERLPAELASLPAEQTVHLTLGTIFNDASAVRDAALAGLRELPVNVVVTTGPDTDPTTLAPQRDNVHATPYVSHALLLPLCDLVVSHAGAGVMFGALAQGVPQLVLPQGADQHMNAAALVQSGAGLQLDGAEVTPEAVASAATRLLTEPAFLHAAQAASRQIEAMPDPCAVIADLTSPVEATIDHRD